MLYCADSLKFDYSKIKADYIFTSPPFFKGAGSLFGDTPMQYLQRCAGWHQHLLEKTGASLAIVHIADDHFSRITETSITPIDFKVRLKPNESNQWWTIEQSDIFALISRYFKSPNGKIILDPFCGTGGFLLMAELLGMDVIGIDLDEEQIKIASKSLGKSFIKS